VGQAAFERKKPSLVQPTVRIHDPITDSAESVIGHHQQRGFFGQQAFQFAQLRIEFLIDP